MIYISIIGFVLFCLLVFFIKGRNRLIAVRNSIDQVQSTIEATVAERENCFKQIVKVCKSAKIKDEEIIEKITSARVQMEDLTILVESYPELGSNANYLGLQKTIVNLEAKLAASRRAHASSLAEYNTAVQSFPGCIFAGSLGYTPIKPKKEADTFFVASESAHGEMDIDL